MFETLVAEQKTGISDDNQDLQDKDALIPVIGEISPGLDDANTNPAPTPSPPPPPPASALATLQINTPGNGY